MSRSPNGLAPPSNLSRPSLTNWNRIWNPNPYRNKRPRNAKNRLYPHPLPLYRFVCACGMLKQGAVRGKDWQSHGPPNISRCRYLISNLRAKPEEYASRRKLGSLNWFYVLEPAPTPIVWPPVTPHYKGWGDVQLYFELDLNAPEWQDFFYAVMTLARWREKEDDWSGGLPIDSMEAAQEAWTEAQRNVRLGVFAKARLVECPGKWTFYGSYGYEMQQAQQPSIPIPQAAVGVTPYDVSLRFLRHVVIDKSEYAKWPALQTEIESLWRPYQEKETAPTLNMVPPEPMAVV